MTQVRLLPLLALAAMCLVALKTSGLVLSGGYVLTGAAPASAQVDESQAERRQKDAVAAPGETPAADKQRPPATAEVQQPSAAPAVEAAEERTAAGDLARPAATPKGAARAVLQSLAERRKALDERERQVELKENLLKAAEQRVEARITALKAIEQRIETRLSKREEARDAEYEKLVVLYSRMKPKDAAKIFDRLGIDVATDIMRRMQPRIMSAIFAAMDPSVAERLTMEIAKRARSEGPTPESLPKIMAEERD